MPGRLVGEALVTISAGSPSATAREVRLEDVRHDPNLGEVGNGEARRGAGLQELAGRDQLLDDRSGDGRANAPDEFRQRPVLLDGLDRRRIHAQGVKLLQRGIAVGLGVGRVGLRLLDLLPGEVVMGKLLGQVRDAAGVLRGRHRLAVSADGGGVIRRSRCGQNVPGLDPRAQRDHQPRDRPRNRRQDGCRLVRIKVHRARCVEGTPERGWPNRLGMDSLLLSSR